jgi:hypothetical protein
VGTDFRDNSPDLASTCFEAADLAMARSVYKAMFAEVDPGWPDNPIGPMGSIWLSHDTYSAAYLIHVAKILWQLSNRNVTAKSYPILCDKVKMLLRPPHVAAYEETLIELEVASGLSERISPISFEPFVPEELTNSPSKPKSPDFGLRLPDSDLTIEVTVWHWQTMRRWDSMVDELKKRLSAGMARAGLNGQISIDLPIKASGEQLLNTLTKAVLHNMKQETAGELVFDTHAGSAQISWNEIPQFQAADELEYPHLPANIQISAIGNVRVESAIGFSTRPIVTDGSIDGALTSLRKALDRKSGQRDPSLPHVLTLSLGHHRLHWDWILPMFAERIWPNEKYRWISALCAFSPRRNWTQGSRNANLTFDWNPGAAIPVPSSFRAIIEGGTTYHPF